MGRHLYRPWPMWQRVSRQALVEAPAPPDYGIYVHTLHHYHILGRLSSTQTPHIDIHTPPQAPNSGFLPRLFPGLCAHCLPNTLLLFLRLVRGAVHYRHPAAGLRLLDSQERDRPPPCRAPLVEQNTRGRLQRVGVRSQTGDFSFLFTLFFDLYTME